MGPKTLILSGYGINCEKETAYAFERAGSSPKIMHINDVVSDVKVLDDCRILVWPGGFSMGDDTGSGLAYANYARDRLSDALTRFIERDTLSIGICNGFQIMSQLGFFPSDIGRYGRADSALTFNSSARYRDLWTDISVVEGNNCVWTKGIKRLFMPIAHGEGRFYANDDVLSRLNENSQVVLRYDDNPNGSVEDIAGICDPTGRFFGLMPHPERSILSVQDALYTLKREIASRDERELPDETDCMMIFNNAVDYFR